MSLINRIALSNIINVNGEDLYSEWSPSFLYQILNLRGQSSAISMVNGVGKTTISEAVLATLSRDSELIGSSRSKFSPASCGAWSHVQVEFVTPKGSATQQDMLSSLGGDVGGETWVFGMCGHRGQNEKCDYYYYKGTLEDLPLGIKDGDKLTLINNVQFKEYRQGIAGFNWAVSKMEWVKAIESHVSIDNLRQIVSFQKKGGSDKSAQLFNFKTRRGERYGETFFYEVLAPAVMSGLMDKEGEEGEHYLEDTIQETVMAVVRANRMVEKKEKEVERQVESAVYLDDVKEFGDEAEQAKKDYDKNIQAMSQEISVLSHLVEENALTGIPNPTMPEGTVGEVAQHLVIELGKDDVRITDRGLSVLLGIETKVVNRMAARNNLSGRKITQVIDYTCHLAREESVLGGYIPTSYDMKNAKKLLKTANNYAPNLSESDVIEILEDAETWFEQEGDTNPYRKELIELLEDRNQYLRDAEEAGKAAEEFHDDQGPLSQKKEEIKDNETAYTDLVKANIFSDDELKSPEKLIEQVEKGEEDTRRALNDFSHKVQKLQDWQEGWDWFNEKYKGKTPDSIKEEYEKRKESLEKYQEKSQVQENGFNENKEASDTKVLELQEELRTFKNKVEAFEKLEGGVKKYSALFSAKNPKGLEKALRARSDQIAKWISKIIEDQSEKLRLSDALDAFYIQHGEGVMPTEWLAEIESERSHLIIKQRDDNAKFKTLNQQKIDLEKESIAANAIQQQALSLFSEHELGYRSLHDFILSQNISDEDKKARLSSFSASLFPPVFNDASSALKAVKLLDEQELPIPVFSASAMESYCRTGIISQDIHGQLFIGVHAGIESRQVQCLLDPSLIEEEKEKVEKKIGAVKQSILKDKERLDLISIDGELVATASDAELAMKVNAKARTKKLERILDALHKRRKRVDTQLNDEAINSIRAQVELVNLGGQEGFNLAKKNSDQCKQEIERWERKQKSIIKALRKNKAILVRINVDLKKVYPFQTQKMLDDASRFYNVDGARFTQDKDVDEKKFKEAYELAKKRLGFKVLFKRAQAYLDVASAETQGESIASQITTLEKKMEQALANQESAKNAADRIEREVIPPLNDIVLMLDKAVYALLTKYKKVVRLSQDVTVLKSDDYTAHSLWHYAKEVKHTDSLEKKAELFQLIEDEINGLDIEGATVKVSRLRNDAKKAEVRFVDASHNAANKGISFAPTEKDILLSASSVSDVKKMQSFCERFKSILKQSGEALVKLKEGAEGARQGVAEQTTHMILQAAQELDLLKRVVKKNHSERKSHFIVNADVATRDDIAKIITGIISLIETLESRRDEDKKNKVEMEGEETYKNGVRKRIRDQIYRSIFSNITVKFVNEDIRINGKPHEFTDNLSTGQKTALSLMWTIRLADFAIEREAKKTRSVSARQKIRNRTENIMIIDGLFSDLSEPGLIESVMAGIEDTRGRFQLIGLIHNNLYKNDFNVFPVFIIGKKDTGIGRNTGWVTFDNEEIVMKDFNNKEAKFAEVVKLPPSQTVEDVE